MRRIGGVCISSNGRAWLRGRCAKGTRPCPGRDPLARPCLHCRGSVGEGDRREWSGHGVEKMNMRKLTGGARQAATAGERRARGRAGPAHGPRARAGKTGRGLAGRLGWLAWRELSRPSLRGLLLPFFFFCFIFLLLYLNSILIFKFGFQIGAPYSLEFFI